MQLRSTRKPGLLFFCLFLLGILIAGCGRKTPPKPPEEFAPRQVEFFEVSGTVDGVELRWAAPKLKADGTSLDDLDHFRVMRAIYQSKRAPRFKKLAHLEYQGLQDGSKVDGQEEKKKGMGFAGLAPSKKKGSDEVVEQFQYLDEQVEPGVRYVYYVAPYNRNGVGGELSPLLSVVFVGEASQVELFVDE